MVAFKAEYENCRQSARLRITVVPEQFQIEIPDRIACGPEAEKASRT